MLQESAQKSSAKSEFSPTVSDEPEQRLLHPAESASEQGSAAQPSEGESTGDQSEYDLEYEKAQKEARRYHEDMERNKREGTYK